MQTVLRLLVLRLEDPLPPLCALKSFFPQTTVLGKSKKKNEKKIKAGGLEFNGAAHAFPGAATLTA